MICQILKHEADALFAGRATTQPAGAPATQSH
jgi:hypothetical protein